MRENALNNVDFGKNFPSTLENTKSNSCSYASCKTRLLVFCYFLCASSSSANVLGIIMEKASESSKKEKTKRELSTRDLEDLMGFVDHDMSVDVEH